MFSNYDDGSGVYSLEYSSPYGQGTMLFYNYNSADYWTNSFYLAGNTHVTLRRLCKRHAKYNSSARFGSCCKKVFEG